MVICLIFLPLKIEKSRKFHSDVDEIARRWRGFSIHIIRQLSANSISWLLVRHLMPKISIKLSKTHLSAHLLDTLEHMLAAVVRNVRDLLFLTAK